MSQDELSETVFQTYNTIGLKNKYKNRVSYLVYGTYTGVINKIIYPFKLGINSFKSLFLYSGFSILIFATS